MAHLIQIGNSHGIRIPKSVIEQAGLADVELSFKVVPEGLLVSPIRKPRDGWEEAFRTAGKQHEDLLQNVSNKFDEEDWEW